MAASRSSLAKFLRITPNKLSKSPPKAQPSSSMPKRKLSTRSRMMDDSDDDFSSYFRRPQPPASPLTLVAFYDGSGKDGRGRTLEEILGWGAGRLESSHDYIQTLFPLPEKSGVNDHAPIINKEVFEAFRSREELRDRMRDAFKKMLWFYGFELKEEDGKLSVIAGPNIEQHSEFWNSRFDHNHLRITRIIRCLRVLGLEKEALAFYDTMSCASSVSSRSRMYWGRAAHRQLNFSPDIHESDADPEDGRIGPKFLFEFEQQQKELAKVLADSKEEHDVEQAIQASQEGEVLTDSKEADAGAGMHANQEGEVANASLADRKGDAGSIHQAGDDTAENELVNGIEPIQQNRVDDKPETNGDVLVNELELDGKEDAMVTTKDGATNEPVKLQEGITLKEAEALVEASLESTAAHPTKTE